MLQCRQGRLTKQYLILSFWLHFAFLFLLFLASCFSRQKKKFIVLGAHSSKDTHAYFRPLNAPKPTATKSSPKVLSPVKRKAIQAKKSPVIKKKPVIKKAVKKVAPKSVQKKAPVKKTTPVKKSLPKKDIAKKVKSASDKQAINKQAKAKEVRPEVIHGGPIDISDNLDPRSRSYQREVAREVKRLWRPPVGVPKGTECVLQVNIDSKGDIKSYELTTKSKVLIYDLSVLQAAKGFIFSKALWGNSLIITFRQ